MKFAYVAEVFDVVEKESSRTVMTHILADLFKKATLHEASIIAYLSLGSLNPPYIGTQFNFAEKGLIKVVAQLLNITPETVSKHKHKCGDLGSVVEHASWYGSSDILSVHDVEKMLQEFMDINGEGSQELKEKKLVKILRALDPLSAKYIVRIIAGSLRLGFSDMTLLDSFSWMETGGKSIRTDLEDAYNISADIGLIIKTLKSGGIHAIQKMTITPGIPIRPAAAERMSDAAAVIKKLGSCVAQSKLDGFRLQVHIDKTHKKPMIRFFSRNLQDMSHMFPDLVEALKDIDVKTLVAEGEAICVDAGTGSFLPFQETVKRKRKHDIDKFVQDFPLKLFLFDVLYVNDKSLLNVPHKDRRKIMLELCEDKRVKQDGVIVPVEERQIHTTAQLEADFNHNIEIGLEGLVVKRPDAIYQPGKRNFNWIKLKRQESGSLDDTLDCVILGYYFGSGKRAHFGLGALLVGVYNKKEDLFQTIAKIGTGFTDAGWKEVKKMCDDITVTQKPRSVDCAKELYPDVWVCPEIVCMIRADEITISPLHTASATEKKLGMALRFPRFMGFRPDKIATEATTVPEVERLYELQFEKKTKKRA